MVSEATTAEASIRELRADDLSAVVVLDELLTEESKEPYWRGVIERFLSEGSSIGLASEGADGLDGYLFAEIRAFEFGSEPCGWIFAVGVHPDAAGRGVGSALLEEARVRLRALGVGAVRTMVRRTDVPILSFFRRHGFVGGPFVQLELEIPPEGGDRNEQEERA